MGQRRNSKSRDEFPHLSLPMFFFPLTLFQPFPPLPTLGPRLPVQGSNSNEGTRNHTTHTKHKRHISSCGLEAQAKFPLTGVRYGNKPDEPLIFKTCFLQGLNINSTIITPCNCPTPWTTNLPASQPHFRCSPLACIIILWLHDTFNF